MRKAPLVSVIMPAFNSGRFIMDSINSVRGQTYTNWELLVIDDASSDQTTEKVRQVMATDDRIKLFNNTNNLGAGFCRNKGIKAAKGNYIAFLDADDLWKTNKLETQLEFMQENRVAVCFSSYERINENGKRRGEIIEALPFLTYQKLEKANYIGNLTGIYHAAEIGKIYGPEIRKRQDWALWLAAIKKGGTAKSVQEPLAIYRLRKNSVSGNKLKMFKYNFMVYHRVLGYDLMKSLRCMVVFLKEHFFVKTRQLKTF